MGNILKKPVRASLLADALNLKIQKTDVGITNIAPIGSIKWGALCFSKKPIQHGFTPLSTGAIICPEGSVPPDGFSLLVSTNPRLDFARALIWLNANIGFVASEEPPDIHPSAKVSPTAVIENGVTIGANTEICHFVVIRSGVTIGANCVVKSGTVIGEKGFGFECDEGGIPIPIIHLGGVLIGDNVEIGALCTVVRGTITNTTIEDNVKIDDHVHIGHNGTVGNSSIITACVEFGDVLVGKRVWVGPNSSIIQKVTIGDDAFIGIGSNVIRSVPAGVTVAGNPAREIKK